MTCSYAICTFNGYQPLANMITEERIQEVKKMLRGGVPDGEVKEGLQKEGYSKEDIDKVFAPHKYDMRSWYLAFGFIFLLGGLWILIENGNWLLLSFSGLMFYQYYREIERVKEQDKKA